MKKILALIFILLGLNTSQAQIVNGSDTLYGNEWINYTQSYFKIPVSEDGIYRLNYASLQASGIPLSNLASNRLRIYTRGREIPIHTSTEGIMSTSDFVEFFGQKNRSELDIHMYPNGLAQMLNPEYSNFNDTASYYLTWQDAPSTLRYKNQANDLTNAPSAEPWFWHIEKKIFNEAPIKEDFNTQHVYLSEFIHGEGFGSVFSKDFSATITPQFIASGQKSELSIRWAGNFAPISTHTTELSLNNTPLATATTTYNTLQNKTFELEPDQLKSTMSVRVFGTSHINDLASVSIIKLKYARLFNFNNQNYFEFELGASATNKLLEIENFNAEGQSPILWDLTNNLRIVTKIENNKIKAVLPPSVFERKMVLFTTNATKNTAQIKPYAFVDLTTSGGNYVMITGKKFLESPTVINDYAAYRASNEGGNYKVKIVDAQQLYDQFAYGVNRHPLAIRNFIKYIKKNWLPVDYIYLVGKGRDYRESRNGVDFEVPTWGYPGSDILLAATNKSESPDFAIGRIAASSTSDLKTYLDKVKGHEYAQKNTPYTAEGRDWMKNILHLNGGGSVSSSIKSYMDQFSSIASSDVWGAKTTQFAKDNVDPVQVSQNQQIYDRINKGVSLITFFGHSSFQVLDFEINNPDLFLNKDKYNAFIALGCVAGNCFQNIQGISENFAFYPNKGSIAFMGTSGSAYLSPSGTYGSTLYKNLTLLNYGKGFGDAIKATNDSLARNRNDPSLRSVMQEFILNGDPAIKINAALSPDVTPDATTIKLEPQVLNVQLDSFNLTFDIANIGRTTNDSMSVTIKQQLPNGGQFDLWKGKVLTPQYRSTLSLNLPFTKEQAIGENRLLIKVDADNNLDEQPAAFAETNNDLMSNSNIGYSFFITDNKVRAVYPSNFGIAGNKTIVLKASSSIITAKSQNFTFEVDTIGTFNSPFKQRNVVNQIAGVIKWQPNIAWQEGKVYYWRVAQDSIKNVGYDWDNSSFIYLPQYTEGGWNQSHVNQFDKNQLDGLQFSKENKGEFEFLDEVRSFETKYNTNAPLSWRPQFYINGAEWGRGITRPEAGLRVVLFYDNYFNPKLDLGRDSLFKEFGLPNTRLWIFDCLDSTNSPGGRKGFMDFMEAIPNGYHVVVYTILQSPNSDLNSQNWAKDSLHFGKNIFNVLEKQGAKTVRNLEKNGKQHYAFAFRKNKEVLAENSGDFINGAPIYFNLVHKKSKGSMLSKLIGPALKWKKLEFDYQIETKSPVSDSLYFNIYGINPISGKDSLLFKNLKSTTEISSIDPKFFPYIKVELYTQDSLLRTAAQLKNWRVLYNSAPDLAFNLNLGYEFNKDTLQQGEGLSLNMNVENLTDEPMDTVDVRYRITDNANKEITQVVKLAPFEKLSNQKISFIFDTKTLMNNNNLKVEINPNKKQPESNYYNNFFLKNFYIEKDKRNPLLDVTFDGVRILNNDIVSAKPNIVIELKDDNKYLSLNDTSLFKLYMETPDLKRQQIMLNDPKVTFTTSDLNKGINSARIEFKPTFSRDGEYKLIVKSKDAAGNNTGDVDYIVAFKVITKSSLSNILPYPNPFSTSTRFAYTLTGSTPPQYFKIQIMTVAGKVVREITQDEIGSLKIGTHLTDYVWDGKDEYGDKLANGVYLYRVIAKDADKKIFEGYSDSNSQNIITFFKEGIGKIVIIR